MTNEIGAFVVSREVSLLYHFTQLENLDSIMQHGILSRKKLADEDIAYQFNDTLRIDGQLQASCFSIEWPNYKMFYSLRMANPKIKWVVLTVHRRVLWTKRCAFCSSNAASTEEIALAIADKFGVSALRRIFEPIEGIPSREELRLPVKFPTNPQAEVLIYDKVGPEDIINILCNEQALKNELVDKYPDHRILRHPPAFEPRMDWKHWKSNGQ